MKLGDFELSQRSAEAVLTIDPMCLDAIWIKAESLYNSCDFEHAMTVFCQGLRVAPAFEGFITGIAKVKFIKIIWLITITFSFQCRKTIQNTLYQDDAFSFPGSTLLLRKLRVDIKNDPHIIERMIGNLPTNKHNEDEVVNARNQILSKWLNLAVRMVMANPSATNVTNVTKCIKQLTNVGGDSQKKHKPVDRLKKDKQYLKKLAKDLSCQPEDNISVAVSASASETIKFLKSRQKFWSQAASSQ